MVWLFFLLMILGASVVIAAFMTFALPMAPLYRYTIPIIILIGGTILYFVSIIYLPKKDHAIIILTMVIGWTILILANIYFWRHHFYIVCQPYYQFKVLEESLSSYNRKQFEFRMEELNLGNGVVGAHVFPVVVDQGPLNVPLTSDQEALTTSRGEEDE